MVGFRQQIVGADAKKLADSRQHLEIRLRLAPLIKAVGSRLDAEGIGELLG